MQNQILTPSDIIYSLKSFKYFIKNLNPYSYPPNEPFVRGDHIDIWADMIQKGNSCIISCRKHSKSMTIYAYLCWRILRETKYNLDIVYLSYIEDLARYHISKIKSMIGRNQYFNQLHDLSSKTTEGIAKYSWDMKQKINIEPAGILTFQRGRHPDILVCLTGDTQIRTNQGLLPINKIKKGSFVLTDKNRYKEVKNISKRFINEKIISLNLDNGQTINITGNHRVKTKRGWKRADELILSDELETL